MNQKNIQWHKIAESEEQIIFSANNIAVVEVRGKQICIGKYQQQLFAFSYKCPHAGGLFADGWIDATGNVVCSLHRYKYSMANGRNVTGEGYYLKHWPVQIREAGIFIGMDETGLLSSPGT